MALISTIDPSSRGKTNVRYAKRSKGTMVHDYEVRFLSFPVILFSFLFFSLGGRLACPNKFFLLRTGVLWKLLKGSRILHVTVAYQGEELRTEPSSCLGLEREPRRHAPPADVMHLHLVDRAFGLQEELRLRCYSQTSPAHVFPMVPSRADTSCQEKSLASSGHNHAHVGERTE